MLVTMRSFVAITAFLAGLAQAAPKHQDRNNYNLDALTQARGKQWFGTAADIPGTGETTDAAYLKILKSQFGEITPANALKVHRIPYPNPTLEQFTTNN